MSTIPRKPRTTRYTKSGYKGVRSTAPAARIQVSKRKYSKNKNLTKTLANISETKYSPLREVNELAPIQVNINRLLYANHFRTGPAVGSDPAGITGIEGFGITQGTDQNQRNGSYVYLKKTHLSVQLTAGPAEQCFPKEYRIILFKRRRNNNIISNPPSVNTELFLKPDGRPFGQGSGGANPTWREIDFFLQPVNKKSFVVYKDMKCILTNPIEPSTTGGNFYNQKYPSAKTMTFDLPHYKKTHYNDTLNQPDTYDANWYVFIYARALGIDNPADTWEISTRGTTTFTDM